MKLKEKNDLCSIFAPKGHSRHIGDGLYATSDELIFNPTFTRNWKWGYTPTTLCAGYINGVPLVASSEEFASMDVNSGEWSLRPGCKEIYALHAKRPNANPLGMVPGPL